MSDEYLFLFAQWGIFNAEQCRIILNQFGSFKEAWQKMSQSDLEQLNISPKKAGRVLKFREQISFENLSGLIRQLEVSIFYIDEETYPEPLRQVPGAPAFLFVRGKLPAFHKSMAIVGTRQVTDYGTLVTQKFTADLVRHGFVVVSGLALGIDSVAHKTTLENNGTTVAVLGSGVDKITPATNYRLAQNIIQSGGAVISAYPLGTPALKHHFPERNSIISGLCQGTLVTEGGLHSGALITARQAHEQGREVFAVPNNINKYALSGTNHLIRSSQAKLVDNIDHILEDLRMESKIMRQEIEFTHEERTLMERLAAGPKTMDELISETIYDIPKLSELIVYLELKKAIVKHGLRWSIA